MRWLFALVLGASALGAGELATAGEKQKIQIRVTDSGYEPKEVTVKKGVPVSLVFTRQTESGCMSEIIVELGDGKEVKKPLPLGKAVAIDATFARSGELAFTCGMKMAGGRITVR